MKPAVLDEAGLVRWGRALGETAARETVFVALLGPLGAGKTRLAQAACAGAGVRDPVTSPTYTLVHWYEGDGGAVAHADLYRIRDASELPGLGWEELESHPGAVFVEWAERAGGELPPDRWEVRLEFAAGGAKRNVTARALGDAPPIPDPALHARAARTPSC
ncbi:tRNA (adenosine(37)-N6)-threonylcarbamoyltransferase complex ATPase subunit type 1 TsaE [Candidatus Palauibacter sp.]|uniref:tRNA (adenosine(37)-N6)-threonylcarbamoyltransferase complex ATPase subunit type 1 TsaE n=1 Tax=Candidatus Palauibacter sp. TaxID=3101350 RepID=UPI003B027F50